LTPRKEALTALADVLAKRPAEEILFDWFRSGRLVGELSVLIKRRHPEVQAEIDRVYQEYLAKLGKRRRDPAAQDDWLWDFVRGRRRFVLACTAQGRRHHHQVQELRHEFGEKKHDAGRQDDSER
jgi:hypothetical protein